MIEKKRFTMRERERVTGILEGRYDPNSKASKEILDRTHVAVTIEAILDNVGLTDDKVASRVATILNRKPEDRFSSKGQHLGSNQTTVDNNALQAARLVMQLKGKFLDDGKSGNINDNLAALTDAQLEDLIKQGADATS